MVYYKLFLIFIATKVIKFYKNLYICAIVNKLKRYWYAE